MHGAVLLDGNNEVLRPALIWCDQRTQAECDEITTKVGSARLIELTCNPALTNFTLTKLLWVRKHEPALWRNFRRFLLPKDFVRLKLTGESVTDVADASGTLLLDVARRKWSAEMCAAAELDRSCLPRLCESTDVAGEISAQAASLTGLKAGTRVVGGAGDQAAGAVGLGITNPGAVSATIGTSGVVFAATDRPALDPHGRIHTFCHAIPGRWHVMGVTQAAGLSLRWFRDQFGDKTISGDAAYTRLCDEAAQAPPGADGVLWAPYLMGERTPHLDPNARAALVGLAANHQRKHIVRAILEGVAFSLRDSLTIFSELNVPAKRIRLGGGGARAPLWQQIQAEVYGMEVETVAVEEGATYGAAILAGVGAGTWPSVDQACEAIVRVATVTQPDPKNVRIMEERYKQYRRVYPALRSVFADNQA
jgi:xylulokinase